MTTRSKRRAEQSGHNEADEASDESAPPPPKAARRKLQPVRGNWSADHLLGSSKSKLTTINLVNLLNHDRAWTELSRDEQKELILMLPDVEVPHLPEDEPLPNIPRQMLKSNSSFQADVRLFQEDLSEGRYDPKWLNDAQAAMEKRAKGDFDDWKQQKREEFWGQKQKIEWNALAGDSSQHSLQDLVAAGYFEVGDTWVLRRAFQKKGDRAEEKVIVEKEAKITEISDDQTLSFAFPPGQHKFSSKTNGDDLLVTDVTGPVALSNAILNEDGRIVGVRGANAWREFRCIRRNQDMGGLWDIRELYHQRQNRKSK